MRNGKNDELEKYLNDRFDRLPPETKRLVWDHESVIFWLFMWERDYWKIKSSEAQNPSETTTDSR